MRRKQMKKTILLMAALALPCLGNLAQADVFNMGSGLKSLQTVLVGDAGNAADMRSQTDGTTSGYGAVSYDYKISTYEVTAAQYCDFLNAVGGSGLGYKALMASTDQCNIVQTGVSGNFHYQIGNGTAGDRLLYGNRAANYVGQASAMRFANWVNNGQGAAATAEYGVYALNGSALEMKANTLTRSATATWAIASEDEWYKAAYYQGDGTYQNYATGSSSDPNHTITSPNTANDANYLRTGSTTVTDVGLFANSASHYGTFDQTGNVAEWTEGFYKLTQTPAYVTDAYVHRQLRGGYFWGAAGDIAAGQRSLVSTSWGSGDAFDGVRLVQLIPANVPEPSSVMAMAGGLLALLGFRKRRA
jgi:formylglycine-generating enzyme